MDLTFGIEEEYFVVSLQSQSVEPSAHDRFLARARELAPANVARELLQSQIEVVTPVCRDMSEARDLLSRSRRAIDTAGREFGLTVVAAGTHPTADWSEQLETPRARYTDVASELQILARRNLVCGMHVHVGIPDQNARIDVMRRCTPFLPVLLALSCSSPFWRGIATGFASYRMTSYSEMPRAGLPPQFESWQQYQQFSDVLVAAGMIPDPSFIWWAIRPSNRHPTLELRIPDVCTSIDDAMAIAALYRCLVRALLFEPGTNTGIGAPQLAVAEENKWRAQRFGLQAEMVDPFGQRTRVAAATIVRDLCRWLLPHAMALDCQAEFDHVERILQRGTSADHQLTIFNEAIEDSLSSDEALGRVSTWLQQETLAGC